MLEKVQSLEREREREKPFHLPCISDRILEEKIIPLEASSEAFIFTINM